MEFKHKIIPLGHKVDIVVTEDHTFGTDAVLLANFAFARHKDQVCDLGTGCGIIASLLKKNNDPKFILGIDIQEKAITQMRATVEKNGWIGKVEPRLMDLRKVREEVSLKESFDLVTCNPPYKLGGTGEVCKSLSHTIARHEQECSLQDVVDSASFLLKQGGKLCLCQRPERLLDVIQAMKQGKIEPKRLQFVSKEEDTPPWLFLIQGVKGGKPHLKVESQFILYKDGKKRKELFKLYE